MVEIVDTSSVGWQMPAEQDAEMRAGANPAFAKSSCCDFLRSGYGLQP